MIVEVCAAKAPGYPVFALCWVRLLGTLWLLEWDTALGAAAATAAYPVSTVSTESTPWLWNRMAKCTDGRT